MNTPVALPNLEAQIHGWCDSEDPRKGIAACEALRQLDALVAVLAEPLRTDLEYVRSVLARRWLEPLSRVMLKLIAGGRGEDAGALLEEMRACADFVAAVAISKIELEAVDAEFKAGRTTLLAPGPGDFNSGKERHG